MEALNIPAVHLALRDPGSERKLPRRWVRSGRNKYGKWGLRWG